MSEYNMGYLVGCAVGVLIGIAAVILLKKFMKKGDSSKCKFDERQRLVRGVGYKYAFFTLLIYNALDMYLGEILKMYMDQIVINCIGICLAIVVYASYTIWNEGYIALNENPKRVTIAFAIIAVFNIAAGVSHVIGGDFLENGRLNYTAVNPICGIVFVILIIEMLVKNASTKKSDER